MAGSWTNVVQVSPGGVGIDRALLLSDGTVMAVQSACGTECSSNWFKLTPDTNGRYVTGSWTPLHPMHYSRTYYASAVLTDGRVFVAGAEYGTPFLPENEGEIYNPLTDTWTETFAPTNLVDAQKGLGECESTLLPDGRLLLAPDTPASCGETIIYDPKADIWSAGSNLFRNCGIYEASWVKLPDDSVLVIDTYGTQSERYIPSLKNWVNDTNVPVAVYDNFNPAEMGAAVLLPTGKALFLGGSGHTALYTPSGTTNAGSWTAGPDFPNPGGTNQLATADAPAAVMPNGKVLCAVSPASPTVQFTTPTTFCEYDPVANSFTVIAGPMNDFATNRKPFTITMLALPDGNVLVCDGEARPYIYQPSGSPQPAWKPSISGITANANGSYHLTGTQLNGVSYGAAYGDDAQMDSNYPLVRMTDNTIGDVRYARTFNWSSTSVQTGSRPVSTEFALPYQFLNRGPHQYSLVAVANGIASDPVTFYGPVWVDFNYVGATQDGSFAFPYKTLTNGISACPANGSIFCKGPASHRETPRITKAMSILAYGGTVTVGR